MWWLERVGRERGDRAPPQKQARLWLILQSPGYSGGSGESSIKLEASLPRAMETPEGSEGVRSVPPHSCGCCHSPFSLPFWKNSDFLFWISVCEVNCPLIYTHCWTVPVFRIKYSSANLFKPFLNKKLCQALSWKAPRELKPWAPFAVTRMKWLEILLPNWLMSSCPAEKWQRMVSHSLCRVW